MSSKSALARPAQPRTAESIVVDAHAPLLEPGGVKIAAVAGAIDASRSHKQPCAKTKERLADFPYESD